MELVGTKVHNRMLSSATAKSLQSCPTLCDPKEGSPPGSTVPGILQARTRVGCHFLLLSSKCGEICVLTDDCCFSSSKCRHRVGQPLLHSAPHCYKPLLSEMTSKVFKGLITLFFLLFIFLLFPFWESD